MKHDSTENRKLMADLKYVPTSDRCSIARESEESFKVETQMTALSKAGASTHNKKPWHAQKWRKAWQTVKRLQMRIAKATLEGKDGKVKALQWIGRRPLS